jgi:hypothetical protein
MFLQTVVWSRLYRYTDTLRLTLLRELHRFRHVGGSVTGESVVQVPAGVSLDIISL